MAIQIHEIRKGTSTSKDRRIQRKLAKKYPALFYALEVSGMVKK
jgi:hypothetical protein